MIQGACLQGREGQEAGGKSSMSYDKIRIKVECNHSEFNRHKQKACSGIKKNILKDTE